MALILWVSSASALTITKDTVYESSFLGRNDSTSLINASADTVNIDSIRFVPPPGKVAELKIRWNQPYSEYRHVSTHILQSRWLFRFSYAEDATIPPKSKKQIAALAMGQCVACPTGSSGSGQGKMDTIRTFVIFYSKDARDTLVVIGDVSTEPLSLYPRLIPVLTSDPIRGKKDGVRLFNGLGRETGGNNRVSFPFIPYSPRKESPVRD